MLEMFIKTLTSYCLKCYEIKRVAGIHVINRVIIDKTFGPMSPNDTVRYMEGDGSDARTCCQCIGICDGKCGGGMVG